MKGSVYSNLVMGMDLNFRQTDENCPDLVNLDQCVSDTVIVPPHSCSSTVIKYCTLCGQLRS